MTLSGSGSLPGSSVTSPASGRGTAYKNHHCWFRKGEKAYRKQKTKPFSVNVTRSLAIYQAVLLVQSCLCKSVVTPSKPEYSDLSAFQLLLTAQDAWVSGDAVLDGNRNLWQAGYMWQSLLLQGVWHSVLSRRQQCVPVDEVQMPGLACLTQAAGLTWQYPNITLRLIRI